MLHTRILYNEVVNTQGMLGCHYTLAFSTKMGLLIPWDLKSFSPEICLKMEDQLHVQSFGRTIFYKILRFCLILLTKELELNKKV